MNGGALRCPAAVLQTFELFAVLDAAERERVSRWLTLERHPRNAFVLRIDEPGDAVHFVVSGTVRACAYSEGGRQVQFEDLGPGAMFGELAAIDGGRRSMDCFAVEDSVVARLPAARLRTLVHELPSVTDALLLRLATLARRQMQRVLEFSTSGVSQRVRLELLRMAAFGVRRANGGVDFERVPTHADIASRISTHREAVSREIKSLEADGIITWRPGVHVIHDVALLADATRDAY